MTDNKIIEAMARLEGYTTACDMWLDGQGGKVAGNVLPAYLTDHNAVQKIIDGLDEYELSGYAKRLIMLFADEVDEQEHLAASSLRIALKATHSQKCEAILKALGKWEEEL